MATSRSVVQYFPEREGYKCGYCGNEDTSLSQGMWAHTMTVQDYQDLIDRGWRRSGKYVYKPVMDKTCCPQYAIKCEVLNFKLNKSHKKVVKRVNKYLNSGVKPGSSKTDSEKIDDVDGGTTAAVCEIPSEKMDEKLSAAIPQDIDYKNVTQLPASSCQATDSGVQQSQSIVSSKKGEEKNPVTAQTSLVQSNLDKPSKRLPRLGTGADPKKGPCKKAKLLRKERWAQKQAQKQASTQDQENCKKKHNESKSLEDFLSEIRSDPAHRLELRLVRSSPRSKEFKDSFLESYAVYKKYQMTVHNDPPDKPTEKQFTRFLVDSPLEAEFTEGGAEHGYGSFHQQYWLDGRLVCVGVLDILPLCVSSVYLYYDPKFFFLSLGTYSALREIEFVRKLHRAEPSIINYYMGYYIHSCPKMRYKGQYVPSFLVCPETYTWHRIEECRSKLDLNKYSRFADPQVEEQNKLLDVNMVLVLYERQAMPYAIYRAINPEADDEDEVKHYGTLAGRCSAERMLLYRE